MGAMACYGCTGNDSVCSLVWQQQPPGLATVTLCTGFRAWAEMPHPNLAAGVSAKKRIARKHGKKLDIHGNPRLNKKNIGNLWPRDSKSRNPRLNIGKSKQNSKAKSTFFRISDDTRLCSKPAL